MERKISYSVYVAAFLISAGIFVLGIFVGQAIGNSNLEKISGEVNSASSRLESIQFLYLSDNASASFCPLYNAEVDSLDKDIETIGYKLTYLEEERGVYDNELKKKYFVLEAQSHLISKKINSLCGDSRILLINFYSNKNCERCKEQGIEVLKARDALNGKIAVKLFSFDGDLYSPISQSYKNQYGITKYPTLIINDKKYEGFYNVQELVEILEKTDGERINETKIN